MTILQQHTVTTRGPHNCWGCTKEFPPGSEMVRIVGVDQGDFTGVYWCGKCEDFLGTLEGWELEDGFSYGELLNYEDIGNERNEIQQ